MCQNRSRLFFRNKYTTTRLRSPKNKHLSKIIVFTIRQRIIIRPQTARIKLFAFYTLFTSKIIIMPTVNNTPIVLQPSSIAEKDSKQNNRPQKTVRIHKLKILPFFSKITSRWKNNVSPLKKTTTLFNPCQSFSTARFDGFLQSIIICAPAITPLPFAP